MFVLAACTAKEPLTQEEAAVLAQQAVSEYAQTHKLEPSKFTAPRALYNNSAGVWEFYYHYDGQGLKGLNILVDRFKRIEVHVVES
jgi:hypothetical protein